MQLLLEFKVECEDCGEFHTNLTNTDNGEVCDDCLENYIKCEHCETMNNSTNEVTTGYRTTTHVCDDCLDNHYFTCEGCGEHLSCDMASFSDSGDSWCEDCYSERFFWCEECDREYHMDDYAGGGCCNECSGSEYVEAYDYEPTLKFKGDNEKQPFLGFELEFEFGNSDKKEVTNTLVDDHIGTDLYYLTRDSSLNNGLELTSMPMTLNYHSVINEELRNGLNYLKNDGDCTSHDTRTCGLHVHIDKRDMTAKHRANFEAFFIKNSRPVEVFARRKSNAFCVFNNKADIKEHVKNVRKGKNNGRKAVNWENKNTVEVRIFKGTLNNDTLLATLEFCTAIYQMTKEVTCKTSGKNRFCGLKWSDFLVFIENKDFPKMKDYLNKRNLV